MQVHCIRKIIYSAMIIIIELSGSYIQLTVTTDEQLVCLYTVQRKTPSNTVPLETDSQPCVSGTTSKC